MTDLLHRSYAKDGDGEDPAEDRGGDDAEAGRQGEAIEYVLGNAASAARRQVFILHIESAEHSNAWLFLAFSIFDRVLLDL
jgi:hypothetical protein